MRMGTSGGLGGLKRHHCSWDPRRAVHSSKPSSSVEPPINFNTNTGFGFPYAFAAITHEVMPSSLSFGETGGGSFHGPRGYVSCVAQAGVFTEGGPPAHLSSLSHLPSNRSPEIFYSFFLFSVPPVSSAAAWLFTPNSHKFFKDPQSPYPSVNYACTASSTWDSFFFFNF